MNVTSPKGNEYVVLGPIGKTEAFNLYECALPDGAAGILKIAVAPENNGDLDREALVLHTLRERADEIESEAARQEPEKGELGYRHFFPNLVESFVDRDQGGRRISILSLSGVASKISDLEPLGHLLSKVRVRVDPKTSVWILGRMLKLLGFAHELGISVALTGENVLVNRENHFVTVFDWSETEIGEGEISPETAREEISNAARETILALGGDLKAETIPEDSQLADDRYQKLLFNFANGSESDALEAHRKFYKLVRELWPRKFHPFTAYPVKATKTAAATAAEEKETE